MTILMMVITFSIERFITITKAKGKGKYFFFSCDVFIKNFHKQDIDAAIKECDSQRGSVANVIKAGLDKI
ncbi:MAG: hypothetical protein MZV64_52370 [Ignavibacteriales bacterium]|nr:hypothetical protein [Ignavibacteriales bacterium]